MIVYSTFLQYKLLTLICTTCLDWPFLYAGCACIYFFVIKVLEINKVGVEVDSVSTMKRTISSEALDNFNIKPTILLISLTINSTCFKISDLQIANERHSTRRGTQQTRRNGASVEQFTDPGIHCSLN